MSPPPARVPLLLLLSGLAWAACATDPEAQLIVPAPDAQTFELEVYPVLLRDCGFPACHGSPARFFQVVGPGRTRLDPETKLFAAATAEEIAFSYNRARSMLAYENTIADAPLLRKPLATVAGGAGHEGLDEWGGDVYLYQGDPGYVALRTWAQTALVNGSGNGESAP